MTRYSKWYWPRGAEANLAGLAGETALHNVAMKDYERGDQLLLDGGARIDELSEERWSPLHLAVKKYQDGLVSTIVRMEAQLELPLRDGRTCAIAQSVYRDTQ